MKKFVILGLACLVFLSCCPGREKSPVLSNWTNNPRTQDWAYTHRYADVRDTISVAPLCVFYGDSITEGWHDDDFFASHKSIALGVSGMTTCQLLCRFRVDVINLHPKYVAIMCGTNDIAQNIGPIDLKTAAGNIISMCELSKYNGIIPLVCSVTPCSLYRWRPELGDCSDKIKEFNGLLKAYCDESSVTYVDYHTSMDNGSGGLKTEYSRDECHLTDAGYKVLESIVAPYLK